MANSSIALLLAGEVISLNLLTFFCVYGSPVYKDYDRNRAELVETRLWIYDNVRGWDAVIGVLHFYEFYVG